MTNPQTKDFDCIEMKREIQSQIYEETKDMTVQQRIDYFRNAVQSSVFKDWWNAAGKNKK